MKRLLIALLLIIAVLPSSARASDWSKGDTFRELAFAALIVVDWGQTLNIADHPERFREYNPILDSHPSQTRVNLYMPAAILLHAVVSYLLPRTCREGWQYVTIGLEAGVITSNFNAGIGIRF